MTLGSSPTELVRRIETGDRRAEAELVERYGEGLIFLLRRWTRDSAAADDLYQETLRLALEKIRAGEVRQPEALTGYLRSLAKNLSIHHYRKVAQRDTREEDLDAAEGPAAAPPSGTEEQLDRLLRAEKAAMVRQLLAELSQERDRQVLFRFYIAEEEKERICFDLGLSGTDFNLVLFRARKRYRKLYEERTGAFGG